MKVSWIDSIDVQNSYVNVIAFIEDMRLLYHPTRYDPVEYGPALCSASFEIEEETVLPTEENELISYLEDLNLEWKVIDYE